DKEAKNYCKKCSNCSRNIVFITEIGQDTFNIQISLQPEENEKVSSEENRDEEQPQHKEESWSLWVIDLIEYVWNIPRLWYNVKVCWFFTGETFGAHKALMEKVKNSNKLFLTLEEEESPKDSHAIVVFCPVNSRVGSDVESAMRDPKVSSSDKPVILVLMHHTRDVNYSTEGRKWSEVYTNIVLEAHVLFHETQPGLLDCRQNDQAIEAVREKLYSYRK
ncbi:hypothetical protein XENOCAPTIV_005819, partial [Xenoophorus captivus]